MSVTTGGRHAGHLVTSSPTGFNPVGCVRQAASRSMHSLRANGDNGSHQTDGNALPSPPEPRRARVALRQNPNASIRFAKVVTATPQSPPKKEDFHCRGAGGFTNRSACANAGVPIVVQCWPRAVRPVITAHQDAPGRCVRAFVTLDNGPRWTGIVPHQRDEVPAIHSSLERAQRPDRR